MPKPLSKCVQSRRSQSIEAANPRVCCIVRMSVFDNRRPLGSKTWRCSMLLHLPAPLHVDFFKGLERRLACKPGWRLSPAKVLRLDYWFRPRLDVQLESCSDCRASCQYLTKLILGNLSSPRRPECLFTTLMYSELQLSAWFERISMFDHWILRLVLSSITISSSAQDLTYAKCFRDGSIHL